MNSLISKEKPCFKVLKEITKLVSCNIQNQGFKGQLQGLVMSVIKGQGRPEGEWYGFAETVIETIFNAKSPEATA